MGADRPLQPYKLSAREYEVYAAGYAAAWMHVKEQAALRGADFDVDMVLVFLQGGAQLRADHAERMRRLEDAVEATLTTHAAFPRLLSCGLCYEEDGEEVHPHPECTVTPSKGALELSDMDAAWGAVWLHGKWQYLTGKMTTPSRELAADAVARWSAYLAEQDSDPDRGEPDGLRWWRE